MPSAQLCMFVTVGGSNARTRGLRVVSIGSCMAVGTELGEDGRGSPSVVLGAVADINVLCCCVCCVASAYNTLSP